MLKSVERLLEFVGDMNATEINDHIKARPDGIVVSFRIDNEWLDGWNRAVLATIEKIEKEVSDRYMELPVDADGVTVHFGDVLSQFGKPMRVFALTDPNEIDAMANIISDGDYGDGDWVRLRKMRHYHEPTVEDVLREFAEKITDSQIPDVHPTYEEAIAEYAKRLRLAGDAE